MSSVTLDALAGSLARVQRHSPGRHRLLALGGTLLLLGAFLSVLLYIVDVAGDPVVFGVLVVAAFLAATALARLLRVVTAFAVGLALLVVGLGWYVLSLPYNPDPLAMVGSNLELLSGENILSIERAPVWALAVAPGPVFTAWYLALRRWYGTAVLVGAAPLAYVVLTGNADLAITLLGVVGAAATVGFGDLDRHGGSGAAGEYVAFALAVMIIVPALVSVVPGGAGLTLSLTDDPGAGESLEGDLIATDEELTVAGAIELTATVRFTVEADRARRWRVSAYDRYTGDGWVRTGGTDPVRAADLESPPGLTDRLEQTFTAESAVDVLPAAWRPLDIDGAPTAGARVSETGGFVPERTLRPGDTYAVTSAIPTPVSTSLRLAGRDYPDRVERYIQLPASLPQRVRTRTENVTGGTANPYALAVRIESWLEQNKDYSLSVDAPTGNVADTFLFEMDRGYCVYYATTMAVMLRTQGVPARVAVGYTPGQPTDDGYVVRGFNSHAWVEVYFPEQGWVAFDPTPTSPRHTAEQARLEEARIAGSRNVDTAGTAPADPATPSPTPTPTEAGSGPVTETVGQGEFAEQIRGGITGPGGGPVDTDASGGADEGIVAALPSRREAALLAVALLGLVAGVRRSGLGRRAYRALWLRYQPRRDPATDVERAYRRVLALLEAAHRPKAPDETPREYLAAVDAGPRVRQVFDARERARHGSGVSERTADDTVELADRLVAERGW